MPIVLALLLLAVVPVWPFLQGDVPRTNDLFPHLYRAFALDQMVALGYLWPRWAAGLVHGYGYPVFNFFPILSHWVTELWHLLGLPLLTAYRAAVYSYFALAALSSYALGRALTGRRAGGWALAVVYTFSPYLLYDAIVRGSPPESLALGLLPLVVWGIYRLSLVDDSRPLFSGFFRLRARRGWDPRLQGGGAGGSPSRRNRRGWDPRLLTPFFLTALAYAAMILSHHPVTLQVSFLLGVWLLLRSWRGGWRFGLQGLIWPAAALLTGGLLTAFFSLPALLEIDATRAQLSISQGYTYESNFLPLAELFRWPMLPADPARLNPPVVRALPLLSLAFSLAALPWSWPRLGRTARRTAVQFALLLVLAVWLITPSSQIAWDLLPLLRYTLYPWRLLGFASLCAAALAAISISAFQLSANQLSAKSAQNSLRTQDSGLATWLLLLLTLLATLEALPWLFPPREPAREVITQAEVSGAELPPFLIGTTTLGEFLPAGVAALPDTAALKEALIAEGNPDRLLVPAGVVRVRQTEDPLDARYQVAADRPVTLTYRQFYFPGWRAALDGSPLPISPDETTGLITVDLPAGSHQLRIWFGSTPTRTAGSVISAVTLVGILWMGVVWRKKWSMVDGQWSMVNVNEAAPSGLRTQDSGLPYLLLSLLPLGLLLFFAFVDTPLRRPTLQEDGVWGRPQIEPLDFAGELRLLTYTQSAAELPADEPIELTTYWRPLRGIGVDYTFGVQIVDERGITWHDGVERPLDWRFVAGEEVWPDGAYRLEPFELTLLDGAPPGAYRFLVGLVRRDTGQTVDAHEIGGFVVTEPARGERPLEAGMTAVGREWAGLALLGARLDRKEARPGDPLRAAVLWRVTDPAAAPDRFQLQLVGETGELLFGTTAGIGGAYPQPDWRVGDRLRSESVIRLPADTPGGRYVVQAVWEEETVDLGQIAVSAPERTAAVPPFEVPVDARLGEVATLLGATVTPCPGAEGVPCAVELVWRAEAETGVSYRVFVHLLDEDGRIVAQSDGEPAGWTRPTTGWLPPEIIADAHILPIPANFPPDTPTTLRAGLYDPASGTRLQTPAGADQVTIYD